MMEIALKTNLSTETKASVLAHEIGSLTNLIAARKIWLSSPVNKKKSTYMAIAKDTREMEDKLQDLQIDLKELHSNTKTA